MQIVLLVCAILVTAAIVVGTVYFVVTMMQLKQTAIEIKNLSKKIDTAFPLLNYMFLYQSVSDIRV